MILRKHMFHSKQLLPWGVAIRLKSGDEQWVHEWCQKNHRHVFSPTDEVADKSNPGHKMIVDRVVYKSESVGGSVVKRILGIICYWWVDIREHEELEKSFK